MKKERNIFMTKFWDTLKNKTKTIHELVKEFPNKTYRELEKYRDADRNEEAQQIFLKQENEELTESQQKQEELRERLKTVEKWVIGAAAVLAAGVTLIGFATNISKAYL